MTRSLNTLRSAIAATLVTVLTTLLGSVTAIAASPYGPLGSTNSPLGTTNNPLGTMTAYAAPAGPLFSPLPLSAYAAYPMAYATASMAAAPRVHMIEGSQAELCYSTDTEETVQTAEGKVIFVVNRTDIPAGDPFIAEVRQHILPLIREQHLELYRIDVRGAASPEGPTLGNERLAIGRAQVLTDTLTAILPSAEGELFHTRTVTEDYELLLSNMKAAGDPDAALVESLMLRWGTNLADLKWALFTAKSRTLWPRLLRDYFPELRATRVTLHFRKSTAAPEQVIETQPVTPPVVLPPVTPEPATPQPATPPTDTLSLSPVDEPIEQPQPATPAEREHRRPVVAISTNLLYDLWYQPDFGFAPMWNGKLEWYPYSERHAFWNHTSLAAGFTSPYYHKWDVHKFFQIRNYEIEARWYHRYDADTQQRYGWYLGAAIDNNIYGIGLSDTRGWQGEGLGGQITGGYVLPLGRCKAWKLEFNLGVGIYRTDYDPYQYEDPFLDSGHGHAEYTPPTFLPGGDIQLHYYYRWYGKASDFKERQHRFRWIGPTQVGISLKYDLLWKRKTKRGVSFRHWEPAGKGGEP